MNKRGQSIIEYALLVILVVLGIVTMGPYALRSINAHFKLWDDGVQDSFTETLAQSPTIPVLSTTCTCTPAAIGCGGTGGGVGSCGPGYQIWHYGCNILGCNGAAGDSFCVYDPVHCCVYAPQGCGSYPCPSSGCPTTTVSPPTPPSADNCYYGQLVMANICNTLPIQCLESLATCALPECQGIVSPGAIQCPNQPPVTGIVTQNYGVTYVQDSAHCNPSSACQYYCDPAHYILNQWATSCINTFEVAPTTCVGAPPGCSCSGGGGFTTTVDCSFGPMCGSAAADITTINIKDVSSPQHSPNCNNPGYPTEQCQLTFNF